MSSQSNILSPPKGQPTHFVYPGLLLGCAVLLATSLLALGHLSTKEAIAERLAEDLKASLAQVMPAERHDNDLLADQLVITGDDRQATIFYPAKQGNELVGMAFPATATDGYGGPIELILAVDQHGQLLGVRVLAHAETPGLGDKLDIAKSDWILAFNGRSLDNTAAKDWAVKKDGGHFDQFTGATITPRAVVKAVRAGLERYRDLQSSLWQLAQQDQQTPAANTLHRNASRNGRSPDSASPQQMTTPWSTGGTGHEQ